MKIREPTRSVVLGFSSFTIVATFIIGVWRALSTVSLLPILIATYFVLCLLPMLIASHRGELNVFEPIIFYCAISLMTGAALIERTYYSEQEFEYEIISYSFETGMTLVSVVLVAMLGATLVGYYIFGPQLPSLTEAFSLRRRILGFSTITGRTYRATALLYLIIGLASFAGIVLFVFPEPNPFYIFLTDEPRSRLFRESNIYVLGARTLYLGYLLWLCGALADRQAPSPLEILFALPLVGLFLLLGGRGRAISVLVLVIVVLYLAFIEELVDLHRGVLAHLSGSIPPAVVLLGLPLISLGIAVGIVLLRSLRLGNDVFEALLSVNILSIASAGAHNDKFDNFLALTELVPEVIDYQFGAFYARVAFNFIPRRIWTEKPVLSVGGVLRRELLPNAAGGRSPGTMGDYYINFGYPGIVMLGVLHGIVLRLTYRIIKRKPANPLSILIFALLLGGFGISGLTNNSLRVLVSNFILLVPAFVIFSIVMLREDNQTKLK